MMRRLLAACAMLAAPVVAGAQQSRCELIGGPTTRQTADTLMGGRSFVGGGVLVKCPGRKITLRGDSAEIYKDRYYVVGHVSYDEPRLNMTSDFLNYFVVDDRIVAAGNVHAKLPSGSTLVGPQAEYDRPIPGRPDRPHRQMRAIARPTITIVQPDSQGKPTPPMTVVATTVFMDGDSLIYGSGQVIITRPDITATCDSAFIDQGHETMRLMRNPSLAGKKDRPFTLTGDLIDMYSSNRKLTRVLARAHATAVSDSMTLKSDTIDLRVTDDVLNHAYAWGRISRALAVSPSESLLADSLDVTMPNQQVRVVRAVRSAYAQGKPDSVRFHVEKPDTVNWLAGDTITAHFDTAATKDTSKTPIIRELIADGHAAAWYHMAPSDTAERRPAINQVSARSITIDFTDQRVATVSARDSVQGIYVEPKADSTAKRAPSKGTPKPPQTPPQTPPTSQKPTVPSRIPLLPKRP